MGRYFIGGEKMKNKLLDSLVIGDLHNIASRQKAIKIAEDSILKAIKGKKFKTIIFLGDLFDKKPTAKERCLLADFINPSREYVKHFPTLLKQHFKIVMWDVLSRDYDKKMSPDDCYNNVVENIQSGSIVVFHDSLKAEDNLKGSLERM